MSKEITIRQCFNCGYLDSHPLRVCANCGGEYEIVQMGLEKYRQLSADQHLIHFWRSVVGLSYISFIDMSKFKIAEIINVPHFNPTRA